MDFSGAQTFNVGSSPVQSQVVFPNSTEIVDTDAITLKVKQEFAAKEKAQTAKKPMTNNPVKAPKKANAA